MGQAPPYQRRVVAVGELALRRSAETSRREASILLRLSESLKNDVGNLVGNFKSWKKLVDNGKMDSEKQEIDNE